MVCRITIGYDDEGQGLPVVLVHGHPFERLMWTPQLPSWPGPGRRVVAADLRGYGHSTVVEGSTPLETFARDTFALLDHLGIEGEVVLGGLLADTFPQAETEQGRQARNELADRLLTEGMAGYAREALPKMIAAYNVDKMPAVAAHVHAMMAGARQRVRRPPCAVVPSAATTATCSPRSRYRCLSWSAGRRPRAEPRTTGRVQHGAPRLPVPADTKVAR